MKKPQEPFKSGNFIHFYETSDNCLIKKHYVHPDFLPDEDEELSLVSKTEEWWYDHDVISLQQILDRIPPGSDPNDIFITIHRDRQINYIDVSLVHRAPNDKAAWEAGRDAEEADYQIRRAQYEKELAEYEIWEKEQKIKKLQNDLAKLKGS